ncbi:MAG: nucleotidyltransferase domain-containing protein [Halobacteriota archaeon]|uniref:nucleotidyltransferase domain-containing protein n=1 Tax=Natronomonas sp. TaxID=2184060 RepID=UPI00397509B6
MVTDTPPEFELLVRCVRPDGAVAADDRLDAVLARDPDWDRVLELSRRHGVTPLLNRGVQKHEASGTALDVPEHVRSGLTDRTRSTAMQNIRFASELRELLEAFEERGVRALPFKGPALEAFAYGDVGMRAYGDLDVLVPREDVTEAVDVLETRGYEWEDVPRLDDSPILGGPFTKPLVAEYELQRDGTTVEVRWRIGDADQPFAPDVETLWERRETVAVAGYDVPVLAPEDRLRMLAFHGTKHKWHLLKWACDFVAAVVATDMDWPDLLDEARQHGDGRRLLIGVSLIDRLFDVSVPDAVRTRLEADPRAERLAAAAIEELYTETTTRPERRDRVAYTARATDSIGGSLRTVLYHSRAHPGLSEYRLLPLPGVFHPIYYLVLPIRHLVERSPFSNGGARGEGAVDRA